MKSRATVMERIGVPTISVGLMLMPAIASMHCSAYWMILALAMAWGGAYLRYRARRAQQTTTFASHSHFSRSATAPVYVVWEMR